MKMTLNTGNMIIKTTDKNNNGDRLIENLDEYSQIFDADMIITGLVIAEQTVPDMSVKISKGVAEDKTVDTFLSSQALASLTVPAADGALDRFDTIEIRRLIDENTPESRQFKDPNTEAISTNVVDTVREYLTEFKLLAGTPGSGISVVAEPGWIKIGEILVSAAVSSIVDAKIYNVDAVVEGGTNTNWTNNITDVYRHGSQKELKTDIFTKGVPAHSLTIPYEEFFSFVQDEGMVWASILAANQGNKPSTNQDKWIPAYAPNVKQQISGSGAVAFGFRNNSLEVDISGGNITISQLPLPSFLGQKVNIVGNGSNFVIVDGGNGIPTSGIKFDELKGVSIVSVEKSSALQWEIVEIPEQVLHIQDQKVTGVQGGSFNSGSWLTRDLNTIRTNTIQGSSLSTNQVTLPAGAYEIEASCPAFAVDNHASRLENITDAVTLFPGTSEFTAGSSQNRSFLKGRISITATKVIALQHRCTTTGAVNGLGITGGSFVSNEIYSDIIIKKIG